jgi:hypothetical protein
VSLREGYLVQQPICAYVLDDIFHAFGVKHLPDKAIFSFYTVVRIIGIEPRKLILPISTPLCRRIA